MRAGQEAGKLSSPPLPRLFSSLPQAYRSDDIPIPMGFVESEPHAAHRQTLIIVNPHKIRMSPLLEWHETDVVRVRCGDLAHVIQPVDHSVTL